MNKYARVVLHVGLSKTGSTSMQANSVLHGDFLAQRGVVYPQFVFEGEEFANHSIPLTAAITQATERYGLRLPQRFPGREQDVLDSCTEQFSQLLQRGNGQTLVLSCELVEGFGPNDARALCDRLTEVSEELCVVAFVRSPLSALASLLQERVKGGKNVAPEVLAGRVRAKCDRMQRHFGAHIDFINYHEATLHPAGLVGAWFELLGIASADIAQLDLVSRNASLSQEAYTLMSAVNEAYPVGGETAGVPDRFPHDLDALTQLPGQRFAIAGLREAPAYQACLDEAVWLGDTLGMTFPEDVVVNQGELWQPETLDALSAVVGQVEQSALRAVIVRELQAQVHSLVERRPADAARLQEIVSAVGD